MGNVGLLYVGAVLLINGVMLLGRMTPRAAAPMNLFVGTLQVVLPTIVIATAHGNTDTILGASGVYLFGFTYLYVGINALADLPAEGLGWFCGFVAIAALVYAGLNAGRLHDPGFAVIWVCWAVLWALFFLVLALGREELSRFTGWVAIVEAPLACAVPAFLGLTGHWHPSAAAGWIAAVGAAMVLFGLWLATARRPRQHEPVPA
jgi:hypothetical protein